MSKRKAIEALLRRYDDDGSAENLADRAFDTGKIAGLRDAASLIMRGSQLHAAITNRANTLARKARASRGK